MCWLVIQIYRWVGRERNERRRRKRKREVFSAIAVRGVARHRDRERPLRRPLTGDVDDRGSSQRQIVSDLNKTARRGTSSLYCARCRDKSFHLINNFR